jgi:hypothetical protein
MVRYDGKTVRLKTLTFRNPKAVIAYSFIARFIKSTVLKRYLLEV